MKELADLSVFNVLIGSCYSDGTFNTYDPFVGFAQLTPLFNGAVEDMMCRHTTDGKAMAVLKTMFGSKDTFAFQTYKLMDDFSTLPKEEQALVRRYMNADTLDKSILQGLSGKAYRVGMGLREANSVLKHLPEEDQHELSGLVQEKRMAEPARVARKRKKYDRMMESERIDSDFNNIAALKPGENASVKYGVNTKTGLEQFALEFGKTIKALNSLPPEVRAKVKTCIKEHRRVPQELGGNAHVIIKYDKYKQKYDNMDAQIQTKIRDYINKM